MDRMVERKHPKYWEGVRDTLQLLYTYMIWHENNPEEREPKSYVIAAQRAVERHCKSCLRELLAIPFSEEDDNPKD